MEYDKINNLLLSEDNELDYQLDNQLDLKRLC